MPFLARITLHPVVGLGGCSVERAVVLPSGALAGDRRFRLVDPEGRCVDRERRPLLARVEAEFDLEARTVTLSSRGSRGREAFALRPGPDGPSAWLGSLLGTEVLLQEREAGGFPADADAPGPLIVATRTLEEVGRWFDLSADDVRHRFPAGLEAGGCDAFWEDTLACPAPAVSPPTLGSLADAAAGDPWAAVPPAPPRSIAVGTAAFAVVGLRALGAAEAFDPRGGAAVAHFREIFESWRRSRLRRDVDATAWSSTYRLGATTRGHDGGGEVRVGDRIVPAAHHASRRESSGPRDQCGGSGT